ncbi:HNH endonuclease [Rosenbergiella sp. S61]|uniref:Putative HNH nuclease YajD n=1 Tax=Rosenbergiella gaditana TaxID=2726987 RepID=A0ABS5T0Y5_9GAMM|nr:HNH endonuclease signature motif containing protein [Rosenbergiella gaditana]MBT0725145.1 HNH endonuclease [Rosenbergiella gaditana]
MPALIPRACRKRGCRGTTTDRSGYCSEHIGESWSQHQRGQSRHQRGYGSSWTRLRAETLKRDRYICQQCLRDGHPSPASTVDHIKAKAHGGTDHPDNLESLCVPCHKAKTSRERMKTTIK